MRVKIKINEDYNDDIIYNVGYNNLLLVTAATSSTTACFCSDKDDLSLLFSSCNLPIEAICSFDSLCHVSSICINS